MFFKKIKERHDALANTKLPQEEVAKLIKTGAFLVDVRSKLVMRIKKHLNELPRDRTLVLFCGTGGRAGKAKEILDANGFKAVNGGGYKVILKILESK